MYVRPRILANARTGVGVGSGIQCRGSGPGKPKTTLTMRGGGCGLGKSAWHDHAIMKGITQGADKGCGYGNCGTTYSHANIPGESLLPSKVSGGAGAVTKLKGLETP